MRATDELAIDDAAEAARGFGLSLRARNRSPMAIRSYQEAIPPYRKSAVRAGFPTTVGRVNPDRVETFIADRLERWRPSEVAKSKWVMWTGTWTSSTSSARAAGHARCRSRQLWLGKKGPLAANAIAQVLGPRCKDAGTPSVGSRGCCADPGGGARSGHWKTSPVGGASPGQGSSRATRLTAVFLCGTATMEDMPASANDHDVRGGGPDWHRPRVLPLPVVILGLCFGVGVFSGVVFGFVRGLRHPATLLGAVVEGGALFGIPAAVAGLVLVTLWYAGRTIRR